MKTWTNESGTIQFDLDSVIGYRYWPSCRESVGFSYGSLEVFTKGGNIHISLDGGGEELRTLLKTRFSDKTEGSVDAVEIFNKISEHKIRIFPSEVESGVFFVSAYTEGRDGCLSVKHFSSGTDILKSVQDLIKKLDKIQ